MTRYQRVVWHHDSIEYPTVLYSEVSDEGFELRKVDQYADGHLDFADSNRSTGSTVLSEKRMPSLDEIASKTEFSPQAITAEEFEGIWRNAVR